MKLGQESGQMDAAGGFKGAVIHTAGTGFISPVQNLSLDVSVVKVNFKTLLFNNTDSDADAVPNL